MVPAADEPSEYDLDLWDPGFIPYRLRVVRIGSLVTALTLAVFLVYRWLPGGDQIPTPVFWTLWTVAAVGTIVTTLLPWQRLFNRGVARYVLYAWSVADMLLVTILIAHSSPDAHSLFFLFVLTTAFFSLEFPIGGQAMLFAFTVACNVWLFSYGHTDITPADLVLRLGLLACLTLLATFATKQLLYRISGLTRTKEEVEGERSLYQSLVEAQSSMGQGVSIADSATGRILYTNDALCRLLGYDREELLASTYLDHLSEEDRKQALEARDQRARGIEPDYPRDLWVIRKDGSRVLLEVVTKSLDQYRVITVSRDVTEDRQTMRELVLREELFRAASELVSDFVYSIAVSPSGAQTWEWATGGFTRVTGYEIDDDEVARGWADLIHPDDEERVAEKYRQVLKHPEDSRFEPRIVTKDGSVRDLAVFGKPVKDRATGLVTRIYGVAQDLTDTKRAEETRQQRAELLHAISELTTDYVYSIRISPDMTSTFEWVTDGYKHITGYTPEETEELGGWPALLHPDDIEASMETFQHILSAPGRSAVSELRIRIKSGEYRWLRTFARTVWDEDAGRAVRLYGAVRDITDTKEAENALRASEQRYRSLFERVPVGLFLRAPDGAGLDANPACVAMYGYPDLETFLATPAEDLYVDPEDRKRWIERIESGNTEGFEIEARKYDGSIFWARLTGLAVHAPDGSTILVEGAVEDITERRQLEDQLRQAQKMEAVGRLAGGIAHDFNNLLTAIIGYCELLAADPELSSRTKADVEEIDQAAQMGADIASQLLDLSRRRVLKPEVLDLNEVVATMEPMLRRLIGDNIVLDTDPSAEACRIEADRSQMEQVVLNLVVNARDAMPDGGEVCLSTRLVDLSEAETSRSLRLHPGRHSILTVSDTGMGIEPDLRDRIFEPFFTTHRGGRSTGLGLSTVYGIVSHYDGHIDVASEVGKGSTFSVIWPEAAPQPVVMARVRAAERWLSGDERILLVEDDDSVRRLARRALEHYGYSVREAAGGREALRLLEDGVVVDLMITDVVMPGMSGRELAKHIIETHPDIKILYMSGYTGEALERMGDLMPHEDFIAKPYRPNSLVAKVRELLNRGQLRAETK